MHYFLCASHLSLRNCFSHFGHCMDTINDYMKIFGWSCIVSGVGCNNRYGLLPTWDILRFYDFTHYHSEFQYNSGKSWPESCGPCLSNKLSGSAARKVVQQFYKAVLSHPLVPLDPHQPRVKAVSGFEVQNCFCLCSESMKMGSLCLPLQQRVAGWLLLSPRHSSPSPSLPLMDIRQQQDRSIPTLFYLRPHCLERAEILCLTKSPDPTLAWNWKHTKPGKSTERLLLNSSSVVHWMCMVLCSWCPLGQDGPSPFGCIPLGHWWHQPSMRGILFQGADPFQLNDRWLLGDESEPSRRGGNMDICGGTGQDEHVPEDAVLWNPTLDFPLASWVSVPGPSAVLRWLQHSHIYGVCNALSLHP